jgi:hypothetical protein
MGTFLENPFSSILMLSLPSNRTNKGLGTERELFRVSRVRKMIKANRAVRRIRLVFRSILFSRKSQRPYQAVTRKRTSNPAKK